MSEGRLTRLAAILTLLLLAPYAGAATPAADRATADGTGGQEITGFAADPTGQFVVAVVAYDAAKSTTPSIPIGGSPAPAHKDLYLCDYGPSENPRSGTGCRGLNQPLATLQTFAPNSPQRVAATYVDSGGRQGRYAIAGPEYRVSLWRHTADTPDWTHETVDRNATQNITMAADASRIVVGVSPTNPAAPGTIEVLYGNNGTLAWRLTLQSAEGGDVRPTSLDYARSGGLLAIGTTNGLLLANPDIDRPTGKLGGIAQAANVNKVQLSRDGQHVAVAASNGVFLAKVKSGGVPSIEANTVFNRGFGEPAQDVALSGDSQWFAAAAGNRIHFFRRLNTSAIAEPVGEAFTAPARVTDIAYDEKGELLVAIAGDVVYGFGRNKNTPIWNFTATQSAFGGLDGPLKSVVVSDDAQRILVAGKTRTMAYSNVLGVTASLAPTNGKTTIEPTQTASLTLTVKNTGSRTDNYSFVVTTPIGWASASAPDIRLDPEQVGTVTFNVTAPIGIEPGVYGVSLRIRSQVSDDLAVRRNVGTSYLPGPSFNYTIARSVVLKVDAPETRIQLRQGGEQTIPVTLINEGNAEGVVNLTVRQELSRGASWDIRFEGGDQVRVPASGSTTVNMIVGAPSNAGSGDRNTITIRAREGETVEATDQIIAYVDPQFGSELRTNRTSWEFYPGQTQIVRLNVTNIGNTDDVYNLSHSITPASVASDWRVIIETPQVSIARGATKTLTVSVKAVASDAREASLTLKALSQSSPDEQENSVILSLTTVPRPPSPEDDDRLLPGPGPLLLVALVAIAALGRRLGGRP